jgi:hypothetical protein
MNINEAHRRFGHVSKGVLEATAKVIGMKLVGTLEVCGSCVMAKAKAKPIAKFTNTHANSPGERLFIDTSGPYTQSVAGNRYWVKIVDDFSRKSWSYFIKNRSDVATNFQSFVHVLLAQGYKVKFICCDNAGEHKPLEAICQALGILLEQTAPHSPQFNGVVERRFVTDRNRGLAMMLDAGFSPAMQGLLWPEAMSTAEKIGNIVANTRNNVCPDELFFGTRSKLYSHLVEFGRKGFVTNRSEIIGKLQPKAQICLMLGYADNHAPDTYSLFNPTTRRIILSRDVVWDKWVFHPTTITSEIAPDARTMLEDDDIFDSFFLPSNNVIPANAPGVATAHPGGVPPALPAPAVGVAAQPPFLQHQPPIPPANNIPAVLDAPLVPPVAEAGRIMTRSEAARQGYNASTPVVTTPDHYLGQNRLTNELKALARDQQGATDISNTDFIAIGDTVSVLELNGEFLKEIFFVFNTTLRSDDDAPKSIWEALADPEK